MEKQNRSPVDAELGARRASEESGTPGRFHHTAAARPAHVIRRAGGASREAVPWRLLVGGRAIPAAAVDRVLQRLVELGALDPTQLGAVRARLEREAHGPGGAIYPDWTAAVHGIAPIDPDRIGSASVARGGVVLTNVARRYHERAALVLELLAAHPSISRFLDGRPCSLTLASTATPAASVIELGAQLHIALACDVFETYALGHLMGLLCHELAIHVMASHDAGVEIEEQMLAGTDLPTGVCRRGVLGVAGGEPYTVNSDRAEHAEHIFGSLPGMQRHAIYRTAVLEMAQQLAAFARRPAPRLALQEVTHLIDYFAMDCASTLAMDGARGDHPQHAGLMADLYNDCVATLQRATADRSLHQLFPQCGSPLRIARQYGALFGPPTLDRPSMASIDRTTYQPTEEQHRHLERLRLRLRWIEPDGRCAFGAIGHLTDQPASAVITDLLELLASDDPLVLEIVRRARQSPDELIREIRAGSPGPAAAPVLLELAAASQLLGVTVLGPDGQTVDVLGGGPLVVRVTSPHPHYHATSSKAAP
jgi:hypothetical protein